MLLLDRIGFAAVLPAFAQSPHPISGLFGSLGVIEQRQRVVSAQAAVGPVLLGLTYLPWNGI